MSHPFSHLTAAARTDQGRVRPRNEDAFVCEPGTGLFAVADGMGGASGGDVASRTAAEHVKEAVRDETGSLVARVRQCREALNAASAWIRQQAARNGQPGMGTTAAVLVFDPVDAGRAAVLHAGDSRVYRFRAGTLEQLMRDHSVAAMAGLTAEQPVPAMFQGVITRAVGVRRTVETETTSVDVRRDDLFLLCTDGLYNCMPRENLERLLAQPGDLEGLADRLVQRALAAGGEDNITVVLVRAGDAAPPTDARPAPAPAGLADTPVLAPAPAAGRRRAWLWLATAALAALGLAAWLRFGEWPVAVPDDAEPPETTNWTAAGAAGPLDEAPDAVPVDPPPEDEPSPVEEPPEVVEEPPPVDEPPEVVAEPPDGAALLDRAAAWAREEEEAAADAEAIKRRHAWVVAAFARLQQWSGTPAAAPSLMIAGRPEARAGEWGRYLRQAQAQWHRAAAAAVARQQAEADALAPARTARLLRWVREGADGASNPQEWQAVERAWLAWQNELERVAAFLEQTPADIPFLTALPPDLMPPGVAAAAYGDRAWALVWPWMDEVWKWHGYWRARLGEEARPELDKLSRQANALWADYAATGYAIRPWRRGADVERIGLFFETLAALTPDGAAGAEPMEP